MHPSLPPQSKARFKKDTTTSIRGEEEQKDLNWDLGF